jgi:hypothetical protein
MSITQVLLLGTFGFLADRPLRFLVTFEAVGGAVQTSPCRRRCAVSLTTLMDGPSTIWPNTRTQIDGIPLGDAWPCGSMPSHCGSKTTTLRQTHSYRTTAMASQYSRARAASLRSIASTLTPEGNRLVLTHVVGLVALVQAFPYTSSPPAEWLPEVLEHQGKVLQMPMPTSVFGNNSFFNDSSENLGGQISPGFPVPAPGG